MIKLKILFLSVLIYSGSALKAHPSESTIYSEEFELRGQRLTLLAHMSRFFEGALGDVALKNEQDAVVSLTGLLEIHLKEEREERQALRMFMPKILALYENKLTLEMQGLWRTQMDYLCQKKKIESLGPAFYETLLFSWEFVDFQGVEAPEYAKDLSCIACQFEEGEPLKISFVRAILPYVKIEGQDDTVFLQNKPSVAHIREKMKDFLEKEQTAVSKMVYESAWGQSCVQGYLDVWAQAQTLGDIDAFINGGMIDFFVS